MLVAELLTLNEHGAHLSVRPYVILYLLYLLYLQ